MRQLMILDEILMTAERRRMFEGRVHITLCYLEDPDWINHLPIFLAQSPNRQFGFYYYHWDAEPQTWTFVMPDDIPKTFLPEAHSFANIGGLKYVCFTGTADEVRAILGSRIE